jgi:hypothetical protein
MTAINEDTMCCCYGDLDVTFGVASRDDKWTMRDILDVIETLNSDCPQFPKARPMCITEGGIYWPATAESNAQWRKNINASDPNLTSLGRQIRFQGADRPIKWPGISTSPPSEWPLELVDKVIGVGDVLGCRAKGAVPFGMVLALMIAFEKNGHTIAFIENVRPVEGGVWTRSKGVQWRVRKRLHPQRRTWTARKPIEHRSGVSPLA